MWFCLLGGLLKNTLGNSIKGTVTLKTLNSWVRINVCKGFQEQVRAPGMLLLTNQLIDLFECLSLIVFVPNRRPATIALLS